MIEYKIIEFEYKYIEDILDLWNSEVGFIFPISEKMFKQKIEKCKYFKKELSYLAIYNRKVIGFILNKVYDNNPIISKYINKGWISLFYVGQNYRKLGIGTNLLTISESKFKDFGVDQISLGSDIHNFFPGIPNDFDNLTDKYFRNRGYNVSYYTHDLVKKLKYEDIEKYQSFNNNKYFDEEKQEDVDVELRYATIQDKSELLDFFNRCFYGRWYDECIEYFNNQQIVKEYLLAIVDKKIVGFLRVNNQLIDEISYNINWASRFEKLVGIGPLGVDPSYRGHGIAKMLLYYSISDSAKNGFTEAMIDWTGLVTYYQKFGYEVWKCYQYTNKTIN